MFLIFKMGRREVGRKVESSSDVGGGALIRLRASARRWEVRSFNPGFLFFKVERLSTHLLKTTKDSGPRGLRLRL